MAIGQAGSITTNSPAANTPITVTFDQPLTDPVLALTATNNGGNQFVLRVTDITTDVNGDATSFTFIIEEWEYHDGAHPATETINWIAVEEGVHTLPDGRIIEAGTTSANHTNTSVSLNGGFTDPPVILTSVMSENDTTTVDSDPLNVTATGFNVRLQEEEAEDNIHAAETVGWIAIQAGGDGTSGSTVLHTTLDDVIDTVGLGATYTNGIVVAETQTINGGNPGTVVIDSQTGSTVDLFFEEEASADAELNHINETVGIVAFEQGMILCFTPGTLIATPRGPVEIAELCQGDLVLTRDHGPRPLRWTSRMQLDAAALSLRPHLAPIRIARDAIAPGVPTRDLVVSPQHRLLIEGWKAELMAGQSEVLVPAKSLVNDTTIRPMASADGADYVHLLFDRHEIVEANGAPTESLFPGELAADALSRAARAELLEIFPEFATTPGALGPTARMTMTVREGRVFA